MSIKFLFSEAYVIIYLVKKMNELKSLCEKVSLIFNIKTFVLLFHFG